MRFHYRFVFRFISFHITSSLRDICSDLKIKQLD